MTVTWKLFLLRTVLVSVSSFLYGPRVLEKGCLPKIVLVACFSPAESLRYDLEIINCDLYR